MEVEKKITFPSTGVFDFPRLFLGGEGMYVDKTEHQYRLAKSTADAQLFISRPPRRDPADKSGVKLRATAVATYNATGTSVRTITDCSDSELPMPIGGSYGFAKDGEGTVTKSDCAVFVVSVHAPQTIK